MNKNRKVRIALNIFTIVFFILFAIMLYQGINKKTQYYNSEYYPKYNVNAYVGGDAYNYIINGNYSTGYFVLAVGFMLAGVICAGTSAIVYTICDSSQSVQDMQGSRQNGIKIESVEHNNHEDDLSDIRGEEI